MAEAAADVERLWQLQDRDPGRVPHIEDDNPRLFAAAVALAVRP
jgi:hypothetical protein